MPIGHATGTASGCQVLPALEMDRAAGGALSLASTNILVSNILMACEPGGTACPDGWRRAGRSRRRPRPDSHARTAAVRACDGCLGRTQDMPFQPLPRPLSVLASVLAAGLMVTVASCSSPITPLGPDGA